MPSVFIARSLVRFLPEVKPYEAVEYVIPLMNGLAMDEGQYSLLSPANRLQSSLYPFFTSCFYPSLSHASIRCGSCILYFVDAFIGHVLTELYDVLVLWPLMVLVVGFADG